MLNVNEFKRKYFMKIPENFRNVLSKILIDENLEILEVISYNFFALNICIGYKIKDKSVYSKFILNNSTIEDINLEKNIKEKYIPFEFFFEYEILYRDIIISNTLKDEEEYLNKISNKYLLFINNRYEYSQKQKEDLYNEWNNFTNKERVYIYQQLNIKSKIKTHSYVNSIYDKKRNFIPFNFPIKINGNEYGYSLSFDSYSVNDLDDSYILLNMVKNNHLINIKSEDKENLLEWSSPISKLLNKCISEHLIEGLMFYEENKHYLLAEEVLIVRMSIKDDKNNPFEVYQKVKDIFKNVLCY